MARAEGTVGGHAAGGALAFAGLALITMRAGQGRLGQFDRAAIRMLRGGRSPAGVAAARAVSALAEPGLAVLPIAAATAIAARRAGWRAACAPCLTVVGGTAVRRLLSRAIARPRPPADMWLIEPEGFSMPSKHTSLAALTAGACAAAVAPDGLGRHGAPVLAAVTVGASRVYLGVHWPTDVLAGWVFAEAWLQLAGAVTPRPARKA